MNVRALLFDLAQRGIKVSAEGDRLRVRAAKGILTPAVQESLQARKAEILHFFRESAGPPKDLEVDLDKEASLDPDIRPTGASPFVEAPSNVLLTGATGLLGAFLLRGLLDRTGARIHCLVRAKSEEQGLERLRQNLHKYGLSRAGDASRLVPILGDLTRPLLGLEREAFDGLARTVEVLYHNAAELSYVLPYESLRPANVGSTIEMLRLACLHRPKQVHYISSVIVLEPLFRRTDLLEEVPATEWRGLSFGYTQSKWAAERLVSVAGTRGLPITIHRPAYITWEGEHGYWNYDDFACRMIRGCVQLGAAPDLDWLLSLTPVDYVGRAIIDLSRSPASVGAIYHLSNPEDIHYRQMVEWMQQRGHAVELLPYRRWRERLAAAGNAVDLLYPLMPFFELAVPGGITERPLRWRIGCARTAEALVRAGGSPAIPPWTSLLEAGFQHFEASGLLKAPEPASRTT